MIRTRIFLGGGFLIIKRRYSWLIVVIALQSCILWSIQPALAQENYSIGRTWGIGVFPPNTLSARLWLSDAIGLEGTFSLLPIVGATYHDEDIEIATLIFASAGAGPLFRMTDGKSLDVYGGLQAGVTGAWTPPLDTFESNLIFLPGVGAIAGLEISLSSQVTLSLETGLWFFYMGGIIIIPGAIPMFLFPGTFNLGVHYYF